MNLNEVEGENELKYQIINKDQRKEFKISTLVELELENVQSINEEIVMQRNQIINNIPRSLNLSDYQKNK